MAQRGDPQPLALEAGDDLAGQVAREGVRLDQDQGPVHVGLRRVGGQREDARRLGLARSASSDVVEPRRRRRLLDAGGAAPVSASQYGHIRHAGSSGLAAGVAAVLELAHAARAAQEVAPRPRSRSAGTAGSRAARSRASAACISSSRSAHVVEVLRRAHDHVDDRPDEREQRRERRAADQHRIVDPAPGVGERPEDERQPDDDEDEDEDVDGRVERVVVDAEDAEGEHACRTEAYSRRRSPRGTSARKRSRARRRSGS